MMIVGGISLAPLSASADAVDSTATQATDELNLRSGPTLNAEIIDVLLPGDSVEITGAPENGFYPVSFQGQSGYAYGYYLSGMESADGPVTPGGTQGEVNVADGPVNFRTGPSTDDAVISVIPDGALVALTGDSANGFVSLTYTDQTGWAHSASVFGSEGDDDGAVDEEPAPPAEEPELPEDDGTTDGVPVGDTVTGSASVIDGNLNLRSGPGLDYGVVSVLPDAAVVDLMGEARNGFQPVSFDGVTGWASAEWLQTGGEEPTQPPAEEPEPTEPPAEEPEPTEPPAEEPAPTEPPAEEPEPTDPPVDGSDGYTEDEIIGIIYAAADQYGQSREDMLRVARCESVLDPSAVNASSNASGLFQFLPSTWATTPYADQDIFDPVANAEAAAWMWENGRRNEWVCQ
jgi:uncharacterized protein YraI